MGPDQACKNPGRPKNASRMVLRGNSQGQKSQVHQRRHTEKQRATWILHLLPDMPKMGIAHRRMRGKVGRNSQSRTAGRVEALHRRLGRTSRGSHAEMKYCGLGQMAGQERREMASLQPTSSKCVQQMQGYAIQQCRRILCVLPHMPEMEAAHNTMRRKTR